MDALRALGVVGPRRPRDGAGGAARATAVKRAVDVADVRAGSSTSSSPGLGDVDPARSRTRTAERARAAIAEAFQKMLEDLGEVPRGAGHRALAAGPGAAPAPTRARSSSCCARRPSAAQLGEIQHGFQEGKFTHALAAALGLGDLTGEMEGLKARARRPRCRDRQALRARSSTAGSRTWPTC